MTLSISLVGAVGLEYAMYQEVFPVRLIMWGLLMLSLLSWAVILSKSTTLIRTRKADAAFIAKVRTSKRPLDLHETEECSPQSLAWSLYNRGAREATYHLLNGEATGDEILVDRGQRLSQGQMKLVHEAFFRAEDDAALRLRAGFSVLNAAYIGAPFLGLLGALWILMTAFSSVEADTQLAQLSPAVSGALAILVTSVLVATPAVFAQIILHAVGRERLKTLSDFRAGLARWFEYGLAARPVSEATSMAAAGVGEAESTSGSRSQRSRPGRKKRELAPIFDPVETRPRGPEINPIARQAALQAVKA